ncbi:MAG: single-stranded DNA-binding protein [Solobacterium sp.]|jgi:single-strand DNA-binding protein|nr:single-stranded DNA-binding protein [Solobacterium sp.]MCH4222068.1 single-stranded DNA-binding protein [Solobacterium sp.]MCH4265730.1 single-stranded DNA-binding protein [Solobacterium sp.]
MINRVVLVGRLTKDVEVRKTQSGLSVASFTVACDRRFSSHNQQEQGQSNQPTADFINCVAWRQSADFLGSYARKGAMVGVEGRIQTRNYNDKDGKKVYVTEIVCDNVSLLESRSQSQSRADNMLPVPNDNDAPSADPFGGSSSSQNAGSNDFNTGPSLDISSDDLPF